MDWSTLLNANRLRESKRNAAVDPRNDFESDFGRVIFSPAMRRMHDKTQVFPLTTDDNIHSRLTHSLEVMAIGHSLGLRVCESPEFIEQCGKDKHELERQVPVILKNACLVHDIGNPPFGHFGETVIKNYFKKFFSTGGSHLKLTKLEKEDFTHFDGNAQGFRILTKLQILDDAYGLNLTYGTLGAFLKYPNADEVNKSVLAQSKRGVFQSEREYFNQIVSECGLNIGSTIVRHPLAYLMEAADSICYLTMDIEDGFNKGWYKYEDLRAAFIKVDGMEEKFKELDSYNAQVTKVVNLRIYLIDRLVKLAVRNFLNNLGKIYSGAYPELIKEDTSGLQKELMDFCVKKIFPRKEIVSLELTGHSVLSGLLDYYINFIFNEDDKYQGRAMGLISNSIFRSALVENELDSAKGVNDLSDYYKLRVIVDFISGMTDQFALNHYQKLSGQKIS